MTIAEAASLTGRPRRTIQWRAANGKIPGATRLIGRGWWLPADAVRALMPEQEASTTK